MSQTGQRGSAAAGGESEIDEARRNRSGAVAGEMLEVGRLHEGAAEPEVGRLRGSSRRKKAGRTIDSDG